MPAEFQTDGIIMILPVIEKSDCTVGLRGILADYDEMSVDNFLHRKQADSWIYEKIYF